MPLCDLALPMVCFGRSNILKNLWRQHMTCATSKSWLDHQLRYVKLGEFPRRKPGWRFTACIGYGVSCELVSRRHRKRPFEHFGVRFASFSITWFVWDMLVFHPSLNDFRPDCGLKSGKLSVWRVEKLRTKLPVTSKNNKILQSLRIDFRARNREVWWKLVPSA